MTYQWIMFDADGTLFDFDQAEAKALQTSFAQIELPFHPTYAEVYQKINAAIWKDFEDGKINADELRIQRFERLFDMLNIRADPDWFSRIYIQHLAQRGELIEQAEEIVKALHPHHSLLLITNGLKDVQRPRLKHSGLDSYFKEIVISEEVGAAKPDPRIFDIAFERMGRPPKSEVLIVGDNLMADIGGGNQYGIATCWFNPAGKPHLDGIVPRYEIRRLEQLLHILEDKDENSSRIMS